MHPAKNFLIHLRLPFQLILAPFMLFGVALSRGHIEVGRFTLAFVVLHVCIYGGTTAYNTHYDKDEGPVGGMENPPPAGPWLLSGGIAIQLAGLVLALFVSAWFFATCFLFALLGVLYSRPVPRLKGKPWPSLFTVMVGQGMLGAIAGACAASQASFDRQLAWGVAGASLLVGGLYPISQVFQMKEDAARGDHTLALLLGRAGTLRLAAGLFTAGSVCLAISASVADRRTEAIAFALAPLPLIALARWACAPDANGFRRVTALQVGAALSFGAYAAARIAGVFRG